MEDQQQKQHVQCQSSNTNNPNNIERSETVRSRWTPKPEQILILESIFNSGMVNPPKDETIRIRKLLEKFGSVGDANVFYWFQNRRSRSRRRQRQMQAAAQLSGGSANPYHQYHCSTNSANSLSLGAAIGFGGSSNFTMNSSSCNSSYNNNFSGSSSSCGLGVGLGVRVGGGGDEGFGGLFLGSTPINFSETDHTSAASSALYPSNHASNFNFHSGFGGSNVSSLITVLINGVATEVPRGAIDMKSMFGENVMLVHSSGVLVPTNDFGFLMQSLQNGESYYLVSKQTQA
ncbi:WUSCHEL-related homeobox 11-like [Trifolium pratense]|uniref:WUSCHEL-related homeobox 11-like n=1 Tax=Trifolium pratense TaxID=57577 RepID=UPI001E696CE7|nr:WUSCHEL-related homeobox 11-like [Trifolium pratense]